MELSVIVPCYNERENILELVERLEKTLARMAVPGEILLVDDGSTDGSGELMEELARVHPCLRPLHHPRNLGIEATWRTALRAARGRYVVVMDADLQYQPEDIHRLYREHLFSNPDLTQGWRSQVGRVKDLRYFLSRGLNLLLNLLFGMDHYDNKSGFFLCEKEVLEEILQHRRRYYYLQTFIAVAAKAKGYRVNQVEALFENRRAGTSFVSQKVWRVVWRVLLDLVQAFMEYRLSGEARGALGSFLAERRHDLPLGTTWPWWRRIYFRLYLALMPFHHWMISRRAGRYFEELSRSQWLSEAEVRQFQSQRLRALINHAYKHVPFYRQRLQELGLRPQDIQRVEDLPKLPILTKDEVREHLYFNLMSDNHTKSRILRVTTSGSTGEPLVVYADRFQLEMRWANTLRNMEWAGYRFGDRQVRLWHSTIGMSRLRVWRERLDARLSRRRFIPVFEMGEATLPRYVRLIRRYRPVLLDGYAEAFHVIARYLGRERITGLRVRGIISSAQTLSQKSRRVIEANFGCRVFDKYGAREFSGVAHECAAHQGYHVNAESYIVEIVKNGHPVGPGEVGEVLVTDLNNYCLPLIRYRLGDLAEAVSGPCPCGRGLPRIGEVEGRLQSIIIGTRRQYLPGAFFLHFFKDYEFAIRQFQVIQERHGELLIKIVRAPRFSEAVEEEIRRTLAHYLGSEMRISFQLVDEIPMVRTGKYCHSLSRLEPDLQDLTLADYAERPL